MIMTDKLKFLFALLVAYRHNIHMLHWKVVGEHFDCVHKLMDKYVDKFNGFIDDIGEMLLSLEQDPLTLQECMELLSNHESDFLVIESTRDYEGEDVFKAIQIMFNDLYVMYTSITSECELGDCVSKLDEHKYWLRVECYYKNMKRMKD